MIQLLCPRAFTWSFENPHCLTTQSSHDVSLFVGVHVCSLIPLQYPALLVKLHTMLVRSWVATISYERDPFVDLDDIAEQRTWPADVEIEDTRTSLVANDKGIT
jgi:hypothetical protein